MSALKQILSKKTDKELLYYVQNVDKHTEEAVRLALNELQTRNVDIPETISENIEVQLKETKIQSKYENTSPWKRNIVEDPDAPLYYSQTAIYIFSILCSVFFGSFMLAANCKDAGRPMWPVILYGLLYTILATYVLEYFSLNMTYPFIANSLGVIIMYEVFWKRYLGGETKYRAKPIWKPLIIAAIIFVPLIFFIIEYTR